jgi:hypothetical protein
MATEPENQASTRDITECSKVLATAPQSRDVNALLTRRFSLETIADLVRSGFAMVHLESTGRRGQTVEVARVRITDAGQRAVSN